MAVKADFHMHSAFSGDSDAPMEEMIKKAISLGLSHICLTEHCDPDYVYLPGEEGMFELNTDSYLYELLKLRQKYQDSIYVGFGVELGLQPHLKRQLAAYAKSQAFDFIIGSSHLCNRKDPYYPAFFEGRSEDEAHQEYFESVLECIRTLPYFDVYGHLDYVVRYGPTKNSGYTYAKHADVFDRILMHLIEEEKGIELNTGGFRSGLGQPNPCIDVLKRYHELGGEIITIGSDAHTPADIASNFDKASDILKACGFKYYCIFQSRMPEYFKI
ncbi:MAG: histidinol-phosphatase HisJ family protein [Lachnospiraceae bacterium]|nr:histidinol-phosphatase HisJ family protein [Lachnospiraceae bacterium]MBO5146978.1 histidinol-phosphatase HisJ family protein [Lachnospiraceae bacterium]